jgi:hypothetical protein
MTRAQAVKAIQFTFLMYRVAWELDFFLVFAWL